MNSNMLTRLGGEKLCGGIVPEIANAPRTDLQYSDRKLTVTTIRDYKNNHNKSTKIIKLYK